MIKLWRERALASERALQRTEESADVDTSDKALANLLERLRMSANPDEIRRLSDQIERVVFHKQFAIP